MSLCNISRPAKSLSQGYSSGLLQRWLLTQSVSSLSANNVNNLKDEVKPFDSMPGPQSWPVLGNLEYMRQGIERLHLIQSDQAKKFHGIYKDNIFGRQLVFISDPVIAEKVFREEEKWPFRDVSTIIGELFNVKRKLSLPPGLPELQGEEWAKLRSILNKHLLKPLNIKNYYHGFNQVAMDALRNISVMRDSKNVVEDVYKDFIGKWSMESIGTFTFGQRVGLLDNPPKKIAIKTYEGMAPVVSTSYKLSRASWLRYVYPLTARKFEKDVAKLYENCTYYVNIVFEHFKDCAKHGTPVDKDIGSSLLAHLIKKDGMSAEECATHAVDVYGAGLDTTSTTVFWLMYLLGLNPEKQEKLFEEVKNIMPDNNIVTASDVQKMPYLRACLKESSRLQPALPAVTRTYTEDVVLEGHIIPAETIILIGLYAMGRDGNTFHDPNSFIPERWLRGNKDAEKVNQFAVRPFGFGSRSCVGKQVAEAEMHVFVAQLVKKFRFEFLDKKLKGKMTFLIEPESPRRFAFYERKIKE